MALCQSSKLHFHSLRSFFKLFATTNFLASPIVGPRYNSLNLTKPSLLHTCLAISTTTKDYSVMSNGLSSILPRVVNKERTLHQDAVVSSEENSVSENPSDGRLMLIDGTSIIYRAYFKILAKLHHGLLSQADGNGDWVLTVFTALSLIIDVLEFTPSHVAVVFDHDGFPFGQTCNSSKESFMAKGRNFRHTLYPLYKSNRPPTPDTIVQGLQYLKASIKAMSIKVIEVPGVEADDVIGTLAFRSVDAGYKVRVVSPDKDFFQLLSPSLRLLRIAPRGEWFHLELRILLKDMDPYNLLSLWMFLLLWVTNLTIFQELKELEMLMQCN